ncbi:hypothetical protein [Bacillus fonticola]|nr:hypothetical protein [Bacillus fonticola]
MRVCEVCGAEEEVMNLDSQEVAHTRMLHLCEDCRNDRKFESFQES